MTKAWPWIIAALLAALGLLTPCIGPVVFGLSTQDNAALSGALGGSLIGASGSLFTLLVVDRRQREVDAISFNIRRANATRLVVAELVSVALSLIDAKRLMDAAIGTIQSGGKVSEWIDLTKAVPRGMPLTERLGSDLLMFDERQIDALVTLRSNIERTKDDIAEVSDGRRLFGLLSSEQIKGAICHDMTVAAECFELFAPDRKFSFRSRSTPELASVILRQQASDSRGV